MYFYLLLVLIVSVLALIMKFGKPINIHYRDYKYAYINNILFVGIVGVIFILLSGLRDVSVGKDTENYRIIFEHLGSSALLKKVPNNISGFPAYRILCKITYLLVGNSYHFFLTLVAIVTYGLILKFIYYTSMDVYMSVVLFILTYALCNSWNLCRQFCAIALGLNFILELHRGHKVKSIISFVVAIFIHNSAIVLAIIYVLKRIRWNRKIFSIYSVILLIGSIFIDKVIYIFFNLFPRYAFLYGSKFAIGDMSNFGGAAQGRKSLVSLLFLAIILFTMLLADESVYSKRCINTWIFMSMMMIEIVLGIVFRNNSMILRAQTYFSIITIVGVPNMIYALRLQKKTKQMISMGFLTVFLIPYIVQIKENFSSVVPYMFFWQ